MKVPLSWLKEFVEINLPLEVLAHRLTIAGLEVEEIHYVGLPLPPERNENTDIQERPEAKITGIAWDPEKIVVGAILEVNPHPNADRLVLCRLDDGRQVQTVLTGAPNLFEYKGTGPLSRPLKVAYAREGAQIYDGHQPGQVLTTLKRAKTRAPRCALAARCGGYRDRWKYGEDPHRLHRPQRSQRMVRRDRRRRLAARGNALARTAQALQSAGTATRLSPRPSEDVATGD